MFGRGPKTYKRMEMLGSYPTCFSLKFMALMVDSVNINTEINDVSQTHVDDEGQPLSADVDI